MTEKFAFLSPEWELAAQSLSDTTTTEAPAGIEFSLNVTIAPTPYGDKEISVVVKDEIAELKDSHVEVADITVKSDYATAYTLFLEGDMKIVLNAMLEGKIVVSGDIAKLLALSNSSEALPGMPFLTTLGEKLQEITLEIEKAIS